MRAVALILLSISFSIPVEAQRSTPREYKVKAVFLYNFTQFVEWPPAAFSRPDAPFIIGILGDDPFGSYLDQTLSGEKILGHSVIVQRYKEIKDIDNCHILFINSPEQNGEALTYIRNRSILTVSDLNNFMKQGGMIRFFTANNKIRLQINPSAAKAGKLTISSKLLRVSEIYD